MADKKRYSLDVRVIGRPKDLAHFLKLCKTMDMLGSQGSSRTIKVFYDGDGAARMKFQIQGDDSKWDKINKEFAKGVDTSKSEIEMGFD